MTKYFLLMILVLSFLIALPCLGKAPKAASSAVEKVNVNEILNKVDRLYRADSSYGVVEMRIENPNWKRTMRLKMWSHGVKKTFIRILEPRKDRGVATLRSDKEMWNYFPKIDKVMKIPPSMMMGSWMGSDFTNDDLVKESTLREDYTGKVVESGKDDQNNYILELIPNEGTATVWGKIVIVVDRKSYIPVRQEYYDEDGTKMRIMKFKEPKEFGGKMLPAIMELVPLTKKGHKTEVEYIELNFKKVKDSVFTLKNLKKRI